MRKVLTVVTGAAAAMLTTQATAQDARSGDRNLLKLGYAHFAFQDDSGTVDGFLTPENSTLDVLDTGTPAGTYTRFIGRHLGVEVLFGLPVEIDIDGADAIADRGMVAEVKALPPTAILGFYPLGPESRVRPYVGAALNHTIFYDAEGTESLSGLVLGESDIDLTSSTSIGGVVGLNVRLRDRLHGAVLAGYVPVKTEATIATETVLVQSNGTTLPLGTFERNVDIDVNPIVFLMSAGVSF